VPSLITKIILLLFSIRTIPLKEYFPHPENPVQSLAYKKLLKIKIKIKIIKQNRDFLGYVIFYFDK
jgi:hypothetical protein